MNEAPTTNQQKIPSFVFFGTPHVASETLEILFSHGIVPSLIVTSPDRPSGRGMKMQSSPVKLWAEAHGIPVLQPERIDSEFSLQLAAYSLQLALVVAYGKILPKDFIESFSLGVLNIHYSLLPHYRGASPVESALLHGDTETGVTIQKMVYELDAGDIVRMDEVSILPTDNTTTLRARLIRIGADILAETLPDYVAGAIVPVPQDHTRATKCGKMKKEDGDITNETNERVKWNKYRAYYEWPRTYFFRDGKRVIISEATFENEKFVIKKVIPEGKKEIPFL
jgi:methionyl-tRNA formyltransferase